MKKSKLRVAQKIRIVLDTNVLVSGLLNFAGPPADVLKFILEEKVILLFNAEIFAEYREVLKRPKFDFDPILSEWLLIFLIIILKVPSMDSITKCFGRTQHNDAINFPIVLIHPLLSG